MTAAASSLQELARAPRPTAEVGGKAANLARLIAAGLPVPDGFVLHATTRHDRPEAARLAALARPQLAALGPALAVRSSAALEDGARGSAAGLFDSRIGVGPAELDVAIAAVLASAASPAARAYLGLRGETGPVAMAILIQRAVPARAHGVVFTASPDPGHRGAALVEAMVGELALPAVVAADGTVLDRADDLPLDDDALRTLVALARRAARAIGATTADVEWRLGDDGLVLVQARPIVAAATSRAPGAADLGFSRAAPTVTWRWDIDHNPDPLSPAQIGLVERVAAIAPYPTRVVDGYLYYGSAARPSAAAPPTPTELAQLFASTVVPAVDAALAGVEAAAPPSLAAALIAYDEVYRLYTVVLGEPLARARAALGPDEAPATISALGRAIARCAAGELERGELERMVAPLAAAWDVAAPTYGEAPALLDHALARARVTGARVTGARAAERAPAPGAATLAEVVAAIGEADDALFYRAQAVVRRALLGFAAARGLARDDVFFLPLAELAAAERTGAPLVEAPTRAARARHERERQRGVAMPLAVRAGRALTTARADGGIFRGRGVGGVARGPVVRVDDGRLARSAVGAVIVARTITPAMVVELAGAVAVVSERGGLLGHAATVARELGLAGVFGCAGAWAGFTDGDEALVDGPAGLVVRLRPR